MSYLIKLVDLLIYRVAKGLCDGQIKKNWTADIDT